MLSLFPLFFGGEVALKLSSMPHASTMSRSHFPKVSLWVLCVHIWYMSCVYRSLYTCVRMCMYREARGRCWGPHAIIFHFIPVRHGLSLTLNCAVPASLAVSKASWSPASALLPAIPSTGVMSTCVAAPRFLWCGGDWSDTLVLFRKHSYLRSHLPSTSSNKH